MLKRSKPTLNFKEVAQNDSKGEPRDLDGTIIIALVYHKFWPTYSIDALDYIIFIHPLSDRNGVSRHSHSKGPHPQFRKILCRGIPSGIAQLRCLI
jgi:hypothetical protein